MQKVIFILCLLSVLCSCSTTRNTTDSNIIKNSNEVTAATVRVECSIERLDTYEERLANCEGTVEELIRLFDDYQRGVDQLKRDYYKLREILEAQELIDVNIDIGDYS